MAVETFMMGLLLKKLKHKASMERMEGKRDE